LGSHVADLLGQTPALLEDVGGVGGRRAEAPGKVEVPDARGDPELQGFRGMRERSQQAAHVLPMSRPLGGVGDAGPLGRALVPERGLPGLAGLLAVMRQQRCLLIQFLGIDLGGRPCDRRMHARPPFPQQGVVRHLLRQRVLEGVLGDR
jgi:hypothetical protein